MAASCAFMLPVATPPNAIIFASGHVTVGDMIRAGFMLNLLAVLLVTLVIEGLAVLSGAL
jgi:sodium-dependent dicarboxylate transporter 2/3/5